MRLALCENINERDAGNNGDRTTLRPQLFHTLPVPDTRMISGPLVWLGFSSSRGPREPSSSAYIHLQSVLYPNPLLHPAAVPLRHVSRWLHHLQTRRELRQI
jgi:hypothetical protein